MRSRDTGLAALRGGRVEGCNRRWRTLARAGPRPWIPVLDGGDAPPPGRERRGDGYPTLDVLALAEAAALLAAGAQARVARVRRAGSERFLEVRLERAGRSRREPVVLATAVDVTAQVRQLRELERMREALHHQERLRTVGELASGVAHDLNNALHALLLRLAPLREPGALPAPHRENAERIAHIASEAVARVQRLEELARRREDRPDERADLVEVVGGAVRLLRAELAAPEAGRPAVAITTRLPPAAVVRGSPPELQQVLTGLLLNAREAMPSGGTIRVAVRRDGRAAPGEVRLTVSDEGTGIAPAHLPRLFDPFFTTKGRRGSGLGLAIAHGVMRRLGGEIQAANRPAGGAVFTLRFPALEPRPAAPEPPPRDGALRPLPPRRVLVVDDDEDNLEAARLVLQALGQHVEVAASGRDAVERVRAGERYELVLTDLGMPGLGGWEVAAEVGALAPRARVYVVTGWAHELASDDPRRGAVAGVLAKPLSVETLVQVVRGAPEPPDAARGAPAGPAAT